MLLQTKLPAIDDKEGSFVPTGMPQIIDAHVHVFPQPVFKAVRGWFDKFGWPIRYKLESSQILSFLLERGVEHVIALQYAHKPGIARELNNYMAKLCSGFKGRVSGMATVFPGEENSGKILEQAFNKGLSGVKLHAHVQCFHMDGKEMIPIYETCVKHDKPLVMHVGREPNSPGYACDPYTFCDSRTLAGVLRDFPDLRVCVPHMGADEFEEYEKLLEIHDNLWLDTTMVLAEYLPGAGLPDLSRMREDRIMYGSDFPNIPYAWDRELKKLKGMSIEKEVLRRITHGNAAEFFSI